MATTFGDRLKHAWSAFRSGPASRVPQFSTGPSTSRRPDLTRLRIGKERTVVASIYTRMAMDFAATTFMHVRVNEDDQFVEVIRSGLNNCLKLDPNLDQSSRAFKQDMALTLFDEAVVAVVPVDTTDDPFQTGSYDILQLRVGHIVEWKPRQVKVRVYNDDKDSGKFEDLWMNKTDVAIVENPLSMVMNEPNSTHQRLIRKLAMMDVVDDKMSSGKLDLIVQLPYVVRGEARTKQSEMRRETIESQLVGSAHGIAYIDASEKITQLNRPIENTLLPQVEYLTGLLMSQLGMTQGILDGTADENTMANYHARTIDPITTAFREEFARKFLTKTARTQGQDIFYYRDPLKAVSVKGLSEAVNSFARNEITAPNDLRPYLGLRPSKDPNAGKTGNRNMAGGNTVIDGATPPASDQTDPNALAGEVDQQPTDAGFSDDDAAMDAIFDDLQSEVDRILGGKPDAES